jgi:CRISPR-associated protein Csm3
MKMIETILVTGTVEVITGLHIGAGNDSVEIGGIDLPVIKDPRSEQPYIPGSSLKGKMRFLAEWLTPEKISRDGEVHQCEDADCFICRVFGSTTRVENRGPTRLIVRDASLTIAEGAEYDPAKFLEVKYENTINRISGTAKNPRPIERVTPQSRFLFEMAYRVFDLGDGGALDRQFLAKLLELLRRVEEDTLGGSGSRGSGKVAFRDIAVQQKAGESRYASTADLIAGSAK